MEMKPRILRLLPEEGQSLSRLWLNATDAAKVCGITVRQLTYWTDKGLVPSSSHNGRSYDVRSLNRAMSIDRLMGGGLTLEKASRFLDESARTDGEEGLASVGATIDDLVASIEDYRRRLPAFLAMANVRQASSMLESVDLAAILTGGEDAGAVAAEVASRLNAVGEVIQDAVAALQSATPVSVAVNEMARAGSSA